MARALVLGATGHIGAHVVRALLAEGHRVRAAYRQARYLGVIEGLPVERVRVDLLDERSVTQAAAGCDWVFHAAGYYPRFHGLRGRCVAEGIDAIRRAMEAIGQAKPSRIVFTSSAATIRRVPGREANEADNEPWPPSGAHPLYGTVKIAMEREVERYGRAGLPVVVTNPSVCLGEYDAHRFSGQIILAFAKYRLPIYVEHTFNAVYTGDVGIGHVRAAERGRVGERYLLTGSQITIKEFAELVARLAGVSPPRWRVPDRAAMAMAGAMEFFGWIARREPILTRDIVASARAGQFLDGAKARRELALPQTSIEEAIRRALGWFRAHGVL